MERVTIEQAFELVRTGQWSLNDFDSWITDVRQWAVEDAEFAGAL